MFEPKDKNAFVSIICGRRNSGKTTLLLKMLLHHKLLKGKFDAVFLINPTYLLDDKYSIIKFTEVYTDFTIETVENLRNFCLEETLMNPKKNFLLILDDCISHEDFKSNQSNNILNELACNSRHINLSIIVLTQVFKGVSLTMRRQADYIIFFNNKNHEELSSLYEEFGVGSKKDFFNLLNNVVFKDRHDFILIDNIDDKIYRNFEIETNLK
jgi:hypothetical protein